MFEKIPIAMAFLSLLEQIQDSYSDLGSDSNSNSDSNSDIDSDMLSESNESRKGLKSTHLRGSIKPSKEKGRSQTVSLWTP